MREKMNPWIAAIFCASLSTITVVGNLACQLMGGPSDVASVSFYCFLPMCFFFVGAYMAELRRENQTLQARLDALVPKTDPGNS